MEMSRAVLYMHLAKLVLNSYWNAKTRWSGASSSAELLAALDASAAANSAVKHP